jgi:hypothetical protein
MNPVRLGRDLALSSYVTWEVEIICGPSAIYPPKVLSKALGGLVYWEVFYEPCVSRSGSRAFKLFFFYLPSTAHLCSVRGCKQIQVGEEYHKHAVVSSTGMYLCYRTLLK